MHDLRLSRFWVIRRRGLIPGSLLKPCRIPGSVLYIIGAGFGGLWAARSLANHPVDVLVIDRNNYHTFLALLYQVAAAELEAEDIAYPVRSILWDLPNVDFMLAPARLID